MTCDVYDSARWSSSSKPRRVAAALPFLSASFTAASAFSPPHPQIAPRSSSSNTLRAAPTRRLSCHPSAPILFPFAQLLMQTSDCFFDERCGAHHLNAQVCYRFKVLCAVYSPPAQRGAKVLLNDVTLVLRGGVITVTSRTKSANIQCEEP